MHYSLSYNVCCVSVVLNVAALCLRCPPSVFYNGTKHKNRISNEIVFINCIVIRLAFIDLHLIYVRNMPDCRARSMGRV